MRISKLLAWQWEGYAQYHQSRANLLMHIILVPLFLAGNLALIAGAMRQDWIEVVAGVACTLLSIALQGRGHRGEHRHHFRLRGVFQNCTGDDDIKRGALRRKVFQR